MMIGLRSRCSVAEGSLTARHSLLPDEHEEESESAAPPYMPIQGQRRPNVAEVRRRRPKDASNCKQQ